MDKCPIRRSLNASRLHTVISSVLMVVILRVPGEGSSQSPSLEGLFWDAHFLYIGGILPIRVHDLYDSVERQAICLQSTLNESRICCTAWLSASSAPGLIFALSTTTHSRLSGAAAAMKKVLS